MTERTSISDARARLPELARRLVREPGAVEYIAHRDLPEDLALMSESHLKYLEATVAELKRKVARPFVVGGSAVSDLEDDALDAALHDLRTESDAAASHRLTELDGGD
jgi:hypothetical protein